MKKGLKKYFDGSCKIDFGEKKIFSHQVYTAIFKPALFYMHIIRLNMYIYRLPECFILDDEEIDKVSQLIFKIIVILQYYNLMYKLYIFYEVIFSFSLLKPYTI